MINELDRLMTITDLSEMLRVPVTPCTGGGTAVWARQATESAVMFDTAGRPSRLGLTRKPTDDRGDVAHIERRRLQQRDAAGRTRTVVRYKVRYRDATGNITARPRPDWSMPSAGRLRSKSRSRPQRGEILDAVS
jgi:hypothetical protein